MYTYWKTPKVQKNSTGRCWGVVLLHTGSVAKQYVSCSKNARDGHLTCHSHKHHEDAAQTMKDGQKP